jgi:regulatory protein
MIPRLQGKEQPSAADVALRGGEGGTGMREGGDESRAGKRRALPRAVTPAYLERAALAYVARFASSAENLRRVLRRKVERRCRARDEEAGPFLALVDEVVARTVRGGFVDDRRYAEARAATLRRRGGSARAIAAKLAGKGLARDTVAEVLAGGEDEELAAAHALARRRRLGPYRTAGRAEFREKDLAALARAGFAFAVARQVIDTQT